jgi:hypothetical protein
VTRRTALLLYPAAALVGASFGLSGLSCVPLPELPPCAVVRPAYDLNPSPLPAGLDYSNPPGLWTYPNGEVYGWSAEEDSTIYNQPGCGR